MDKNRVFAQRLRQSVQTYFDEPWALTYANADRLLDMRDEEMALRDEEVTRELAEDLEYEELTRSANSWRRSSKNNLPCTKPDKCR